MIKLLMAGSLILAFLVSVGCLIYGLTISGYHYNRRH
jgi:hypothetical protein